MGYSLCIALKDETGMNYLTGAYEFNDNKYNKDYEFYQILNNHCSFVEEDECYKPIVSGSNYHDILAEVAELGVNYDVFKTIVDALLAGEEIYFYHSW